MSSGSSGELKGQMRHRAKDADAWGDSSLASLGVPSVVERV